MESSISERCDDVNNADFVNAFVITSHGATTTILLVGNVKILLKVWYTSLKLFETIPRRYRLG